MVFTNSSCTIFSLQDSNSGSDSEDANFSTLRELLIRPAHKANGSGAPSPANSPHSESPALANNPSNNQPIKSHLDTLDQVTIMTDKNLFLVNILSHQS